MSTNPTFASTNALHRWTRFVLVNDRAPSVGADCALCGNKIEKGYVRESRTRLLYCATQCYAGHAIAIEKLQRRVS